MSKKHSAKAKEKNKKRAMRKVTMDLKPEQWQWIFGNQVQIKLEIWKQIDTKGGSSRPVNSHLWKDPIHTYYQLFLSTCLIFIFLNNNNNSNNHFHFYVIRFKFTTIKTKLFFLVLSIKTKQNCWSTKK